MMGIYRGFFYLLLIGASAVGLAWFADRPGVLTIEWLTYEIDITLFRAVVLLFILTVVLFLVFAFLMRVVTSPKRWRHHLQRRREERGYVALRKGIFAVGAGDESLAARFAAEARRTLPREPMTKLLSAQSAQLSGDRRTAQRIFESMVDNSESRLLGLRGLFLEASREQQWEAARQYAARAMTLNPSLPWPVHSLFDLQCRVRDWQGALETLTIARNYRHLDRKTLDRRRAVLLTAQAMDLENKDPTKAAELAQEAHKLAPSFVPAATLAGRILAGQGATYKAARVLARTWQYTPHPDIAISYAYARPGDSPHDRLARIKSLIILTPDHPEARIALATAAADARDWEEARAALEPLISQNPSARVCALMARIEGGEKRDAGRVREWLARAVRAPRDPMWIADGVASNEWAPISPVTGTLDAFEWRVPPDRISENGGDTLLDEVSALSRELENMARSMGEKSVTLEDAPVAITVTAQNKAETAKAPPPPSPKAAENAAREASKTSESPAKPVVEIEIPKVADAPPRPDAPKKAANVVNATIEPSPAASERRASKTATEVQTVTAIAEISPPIPPSEPAAKPARKIETKIFVADRPPDDPGPDRSDIDEPQTPYERFRNSLKQVN